MFKSVAPQPSPLTRQELVDDLVPAILIQLGHAIDTQRPLAGLGASDEHHIACELRVLLHPDSWKAALPMLPLLTSRLQRSADAHSQYRELPVEFAVAIVPAPTSSGNAFAIEIDGALFGPGEKAGKTSHVTRTADLDPDPPSRITGRRPAAELNSAKTRPLGGASKTAWVVGVNDHDGVASVFPLTTMFLTIGRTAPADSDIQADIQLSAGDTVSRRQLALRAIDDGRLGVECVNLGLNAIRINGEMVSGHVDGSPMVTAIDAAPAFRRLLSDGAEIVVGGGEGVTLRIGHGRGIVEPSATPATKPL